jgi:hypothetical protein
MAYAILEFKICNLFAKRKEQENGEERPVECLLLFSSGAACQVARGGAGQVERRSPF